MGVATNPLRKICSGKILRRTRINTMPSLCHRPKCRTYSNLCKLCKSLAPEILSWEIFNCVESLRRQTAENFESLRFTVVNWIVLPPPTFLLRLCEIQVKIPLVTEYWHPFQVYLCVSSWKSWKLFTKTTLQFKSFKGPGYFFPG